MRRSLLLALLVLAPLGASAHATPVETTPESAAVLTQAPQAVTIRFSEHPDEGASAIKVTGPKGEVVSQGNARIAGSDARVLSVPMRGDGDGTYLVSWSVVSADDGHFTKGAYPFAVGKGQVVSASAADVQIVQVATTPEAVSSAVELAGNGIIWAILFLLVFAIRPLLRSGGWERERRAIEGYLSAIMWSGLAAAFVGGVLQVLVKAGDLATLQSSSFAQALPVYIGTTAGEATLWRIGAILAVAAVFSLGRRSMLRARSFTLWEGALMSGMLVFAYFRASISHATANPFHPHISVAVNFLHLVEKDVWAGILLTLLVFALSARMQSFLSALLPRAFALLAIDVGAVSVTACYIVWLHLKDFGNLLTTQWGGAFLELLTVAVLVVAFRSYHVAARLWRPQSFARFLPLTLGAELACALLVVYFSSLVIITSPPLEQPALPVYRATDQSVTITLEKDAYEDGMLLLTTEGGKGTLSVPTVTEQAEGDPQSIELAKRWNGGYVFPELLLAPKEASAFTVVVPQSGGYDARVSFVVPAGAFALPQGWESVRAFDAFAAVMLLLAVAAAAYAFGLWYLSRQAASSALLLGSSRALQACIGCVCTFALGLLLTVGIQATGATNPFKAECEADGNMWHLMLPTRAGVPLTERSAEGCMWGMGDYMYMFADQREYDYNRALPKAEVSLASAPTHLIAGVPATLTVSLSEPSGEPASLFVDMEKYLHMVIVSRDQSAFAHIHAKQTSQEIKNSSYSFSYTFPKAGEYLVSVDYAHGLTLESKQFTVSVAGAPLQRSAPVEYPAEGDFGGYHVALKYALPVAGKVETMQYTITKNGAPVTNLEQYLSAAMHVSVVKNDFSAFIHLHGEIHPPGTPLPPIIVKNGQVLHTMANMMSVPERFGPTVETHLIFPTPGLYTVWGEFKAEGVVIPTVFSVRVEE